MNLVLFSGNNYYNRKVFKANTVNQYVSKYEMTELTTVQGVSFIYGNGVTTNQIVNLDPIALGYPDYALLLNDDNTIDSRWYVTECIHVRKGQINLKLMRDVIADWYEDIVSSPAFINKGTVMTINDTAIFNNEEMMFNQIKQSEFALKDKSNSGWYVAYISKDLENKNIHIPEIDIEATDEYNTISEYPYARYILDQSDIFEPNKLFLSNAENVTHIMHAYHIWAGITTYNYMIGWDNNGNAKLPPMTLDNINYYQYENTQVLQESKAETAVGFSGFDVDRVQAVYSAAKGYPDWKQLAETYSGTHSEEETATFLKENGKIIKVGDSYKRINIVNPYGQPAPIINKISNSTPYFSRMYEVAGKSGVMSLTYSGTVSAISFDANCYLIELSDAQEPQYTFTLEGKNTRQPTTEEAYDIIAIPAHAVKVDDSSITGYSSPEFSKRLISEISNSLSKTEGAQQIFDVQYVPYCPLSDEFITELEETWLFEQKRGQINVSLMTSSNPVQYQILSASDGKWTILIYASKAKFKKQIIKNQISVPSNVSDYKIANECDFYRLCSPNYNGQFEFSATQNGGVTGWNISFTYKPFIPYIRVSPIFGRLYGKDFGDSRGLICGGDFSMTQTNEAWTTFEVQNKNYQAIFDRQIQNMSANNSIERTREVFSAALGTAEGMISGASGGSSYGPYGAAAGAIVGGMVSATAGIIDIKLNDMLRAEAIDYAKDLYGYNLQNIKALPYSLTKVGTQNADYKIWPFVEMYSCTSIEKEALRNKLKWNGYSIGRVDKISNYILERGWFTFSNDVGYFIQAELIRLESSSKSNNLINDVINVELKKGVYFLV